MIWISLSLLLLLLCTKRIDAFSTATSTVICPAFFFVLTLDDYLRIWNRTQVDYGDYLLKNGSQLSTEFYYDAREVEKLYETHLCPTISVVITDHFNRFEREISEWIHYECKRLHKLVEGKSECFRPTSLTLVMQPVPPPPSVSHPIPKITRNDSIEDHHAKTLDALHIHGISTTYEPTSSPTILVLPCETFPTHADCVPENNSNNQQCDWFGLVLGCRDVGFCAFNTREACLARKKWCKWRHQKGCYSRNFS